jgi:hypothetical protein
MATGGSVAKHASYIISATAYLTAGVATIIGAVNAIATNELDAAMNATITVSGADMRLSVTGLAATTIVWSHHSEFIIV